MTDANRSLAKQHFRLRANIYDLAREQLHQLLHPLVGELYFRHCLIGCHTVYDRPGLRLIVKTMDDVNHTYSLNAHLQTDVSAVKAWVEKLCHRLCDTGILHLLDYFDADIGANPSGKEVKMAHPEFDSRYHSQ
jgi:hypothetical protein